MRSEYKFVTRRVIDTIDVQGGLVAYRDDEYVNGKLESSLEGIAPDRNIKEMTIHEALHEEINEKVSLGEEMTGTYSLYPRTIREIVRGIPFGNLYEKGTVEHFQSEMTLKPHTYLSKHGMDGAELLCLSGYDHNMYDINKVIQPKAIYFDYISARIDNEYYDLAEVVRVLEQRDDIKWMDHRKPWEKGRGRIFDIPYYNQTEGRGKCIEFVWVPSDVDFAKVRDSVSGRRTKGKSSHYEVICEDIFGLKRINGRGDD